MEPTPSSKRQWHPPAITIEMPFRQTQFVNGCAGDGSALATNTFTPVVKTGAAVDSTFPTCIASS